VSAAVASQRAPHLLWVNHFAVSPDMGGGTRHFEMARELVRLGWRVTIVASDFHLHGRSYMRREDSRDRAPHTDVLDDVRFVWLWAAPYRRNDTRRALNWTTFGRSLSRWLRSADSPDLIIGSTPHLFAALASWRAARRLGVPFLLEVRDLWPESLIVGGRARGPAYRALSGMAHLLYRVADRIIVLTRGVGDYLTTFGVSPERIIFAPNGVDVAAYAAPERTISEEIRLVYAGAHGPANGLEAVLDAADLLRHVPRLSFHLIGDGPSKAQLVADAHARALPNVHFGEPIPKRDMPAFLQSCHAGLMILKDVPLFSFGVSPNKLFDYWGAALPVVNNVSGEIAEMVRSSRGGVQARDASGEALAAAIQQLLQLPPAERLALGACGRAWVQRERDRPVIARRFDTALREVIPAT
jgi:glycosyltransferase involved in cell wall biosynthesis